MSEGAGAHATVWRAVEDFFEHMAAGRMDDVLAAFAPDEDVALYGSEASEAFVGRSAIGDFLRRLFARGHGPRFTFLRHRIASEGDTAWFVADAEVEAGGIRVAPYRVSGVLVRRDGRWLWKLFNGSEPAPDR
jgi:ketosteroid isomerase-like protein